MITAVETAPITSTAVIAMTARWPARLPGKSGLRRPRPSETISAHSDEQPAGDVERDFALLGGEHGREVGRERVHGASLADAPRGYAAPARWSRRCAQPSDALEGLPDFPFASHYREVDGLRLAHIDEGEGAPVIFIHGEPTWSFLWRKVIPPVRDAGFRCIAPDLAGFGRSDKPTDIDWYSYDRHTALAATLLEDLDLQRRDDRRARLGRADRPAPGGRARRARSSGW